MTVFGLRRVPVGAEEEEEVPERAQEPAPEPASAAGVLRRLRDAGLRPRKHRDQHFLHDPGLLQAVVEDAKVSSETRVFEVGTGPGTLTRQLAARASKVLTVEVDPAMAAFAQQDLGSLDNVTVLCEDVLEGRRLNPRVEASLRRIQPFVWLSNLPYSIAATLIVVVLESPLEWTRAVLLVQEEVAGRLAAGPGERAYGPVSALVAFWANVRPGRAVPPGAFWPPPKVKSRFVHLEPHVIGPRRDYQAYAAWVKGLFKGRRKQIGKLLKAAIGPDRAARALQAGGLNSAARPGELKARDFLFLAQEFPLNVV